MVMNSVVCSVIVIVIMCVMVMIPSLDVCLVLLSVCMNARPPQPPVEVIGPSPAMDKEFSSCDCHFYLRDIGGQQRDCWTPAGPWREAARCRR